MTGDPIRPKSRGRPQPRELLPLVPVSLPVSVSQPADDAGLGGRVDATIWVPSPARVDD